MTFTPVFGLTEVAIVARRCHSAVGQRHYGHLLVDNGVDFRHGSVNLYVPVLPTGVFAFERHFAADFHHIVVAAVTTQHFADEVTAVALGDGGEIELCPFVFFDDFTLFD